jgi:two-component system response regulator FixJ
MAVPLIFVIDDQRAVREALGEMLRTFGHNVEIYDSAQAFLGSLADHPRGCVVADVRMPGMDGIELVRELSRRSISLPVVLISGHADVQMAVAAIKAGAEDFIEKPVDDAHLLAAINRALARMFDEISTEQTLLDLRTRLDRLTPRELEVMDLVVEGCTSQAIAARLNISQRTVESYRVQIMDKMQAASVAVLVRQSIRLRRITP